ncbi:CHAD domain-containing protein [Pseudonocardia sp. GCM10023141]|uniref:CYTH and CHAD domain-containing protein n=1 Tax=Pseudonocardia sp. GCM10023141 TaxID=3252653 RepID=UPI0036140B51
MTGDGVTATQEIERKYDTTADLTLPDPAELLGAGAVPAPVDDLLEAVYFDTPDLLLLHDGVTLRRRTGGKDAGWHLKLPAGPDHREELQVPLTRARSRPPAALVALVRAYARGAELEPVAELTTRRRRWVLPDGDGALRAELVDDDVTARTFGADAGSRRWREIEVELGGSGSRSLLDKVERRLLAAGLHRSGSATKLGRALDGDERAAAAPSVPGPRSDAGSVVVAYLRTHAHELRRNDPLVRLDREDAVHQMRVSARRLRSALQAFGRVLDRGRTGPLIEELAWFAGELAPARDGEVLAEHITAMLAQLPPDLVLGPVRAATTATFARRGADARKRALSALNSDRYLALLRLVDATLADPPFTARAERAARRELPRSVGRVYRTLERRIADAERAEPGPERDEALHAARTRAKRLRYAAEAAVPAIGGPARKLQRPLSRMQDVLGAHQDTLVSRAVLRELAVAAHLDGANAFTYGLLHGAEAVRAAQAESEVPTVGKGLRHRRNVGWLSR